MLAQRRLPAPNKEGAITAAPRRRREGLGLGLGLDLKQGGSPEVALWREEPDR